MVQTDIHGRHDNIILRVRFSC